MKSETVPVFANRAPWNELILRGKRQVKTLPRNWKYRGPVLLYTSSNRIDDFGWEYYPTLRNTKNADLSLGSIVGYVTVVDVMPEEEFYRKHHEYFEKDPALHDTLGQSHVVIVENPKRFKKPIPYKPTAHAMRISRGPAALLRRPTV
jgi:hypothetical protein